MEARRFEGYDEELLSEGIVIHDVDLTKNHDPNSDLPDVAKLVGSYRPGQTFADYANGVIVRVTGETASGFNVNIREQDPIIIPKKKRKRRH